MRHEDFYTTFDLRSFARDLIVALIHYERDPAEKKARIMIARADGHITDQEAEEWIFDYGLEAA